MRNKEHCDRFLAGDYSPRVVEFNHREGHLLFRAWTPTAEGPARPDYAAAMADLRDLNRVWIIEHETERDDETGRPLTWSDVNGWGLDEATTFDATARYRAAYLPLGGRWSFQP